MLSVARFVGGVLAASVIGAVAYVVYLEQLVRYWDRKIDELCAIDGGKNVGLRVYERVLAPEHYLRPATKAMPGDIFIPRTDRTPTDTEPIIEKLVHIEILRARNPKVSKFSERIVRVADGKILAEEVGYMRAGGGMPMPDPGGSHICPEIESTAQKTRAMYKEVFINHPLNK
jgi:hypothetical protein